MNKYPDAVLSTAETSKTDIPITPLPNPGGGGPVSSGNGTDNGGIPMIPLPNPGEGDPVDSGNRPFPPVFRPVFPGGTGGSVIVIPGIVFPCFNYTATSFGRVRFLDASTGYQPFYMYLGNWMVASGLANGDITSYMQSVSGTRTITVSGANGYAYIQKSIQMSAPSSMTVAIINTASGLDIMEVPDISYSVPSGNSCLYTCNLLQNLGPFDMSTGNQNNSYTAFTNVRCREIAPYTSFYPGQYQLYIVRIGTFPSAYVATVIANMSASMSYILYIFNAPSAAEGLRTIVVSN